MLNLIYKPFMTTMEHRILFISYLYKSEIDYSFRQKRLLGLQSGNLSLLFMLNFWVSIRLRLGDVLLLLVAEQDLRLHPRLNASVQHRRHLPQLSAATCWCL